MPWPARICPACGRKVVRRLSACIAPAGRPSVPACITETQETNSRPRSLRARPSGARAGSAHAGKNGAIGAARLAPTVRNRTEFGVLGALVRVRCQAGTAPDTVGNQEIGRLYFLYAEFINLLENACNLSGKEVFKT